MPSGDHFMESSMTMSRTVPCACHAMSSRQHHLPRRGLLRWATAAGIGLALAPVVGRAQGKQYRAMLLSCVDPRTQTPIAGWMNAPAPGSHAIGLDGKYSQFTVAGAAVGVVAPAFAGWEATFWDNIAASIQLHDITNLIVVDHGNCGALGIAYGQRVLDDPKLEWAAHLADTTRLKQELATRHPDLDYQAWFVDRDADGRFNQWKVLVAGPEIA
jgi:carbonic anhydrase